MYMHVFCIHVCLHVSIVEYIHVCIVCIYALNICWVCACMRVCWVIIQSGFIIIGHIEVFWKTLMYMLPKALLAYMVPNVVKRGTWRITTGQGSIHKRDCEICTFKNEGETKRAGWGKSAGLGDARSSPEPLEWEHWLQDPRLPEN